jgi:hypothetical protein
MPGIEARGTIISPILNRNPLTPLVPLIPLDFCFPLVDIDKLAHLFYDISVSTHRVIAAPEYVVK